MIACNVALGGLAGGGWPDSGEWLAGKGWGKGGGRPGAHHGLVLDRRWGRNAAGEHGRRSRAAAATKAVAPASSRPRIDKGWR
jgi:hypothetical protein